MQIKNAKKLTSGMYRGKKVSKLIGNVKLKQGTTVIWCDSAYYLDKANTLVAFGHVHVKSKKLDVYGDFLEYDGNSKQSYIRKNVRLRDGKSMTLTTDNLDYNFGSGVASYFGGGKVVDKGTTLTSEGGTFYRYSGNYHFKKNVVLNRNNQVLNTDTLRYVAKTQNAYFYGPTNITTGNRQLYAESGIYNTKTETAAFKENAWIKTPTFYLEGDSIFFDNEKDFGYAKDNAFLFSYKDSVTITGDEMFRWGKEFKSKIIGNPVMRQISGGDTTFLKADTLISIEDTLNKSNQIYAYDNVSFLKGSLQGKCDSMAYVTTDSVLNFYNHPVLWSGGSQITADTIYVVLEGNGIKSLHANVNAFVISEDKTKTEYNQVKGKNLIGFFEDGKMVQVDVSKNGESIYYAKDDDGELMGINKIECGEMNIFMKEGEVDNILFLTTPDARFIPPSQLTEESSHLSGFKWMESVRPKISLFLSSFDRNTKK